MHSTKGDHLPVVSHCHLYFLYHCATIACFLSSFLSLISYIFSQLAFMDIHPSLTQWLIHCSCWTNNICMWWASKWSSRKMPRAESGHPTRAPFLCGVQVQVLLLVVDIFSLLIANIKQKIAKLRFKKMFSEKPKKTYLFSINSVLRTTKHPLGF